MNKTDDQIRSDIGRNESSAEWGAGAVFAGLILEVILALVKSLGFESSFEATLRIRWAAVENWGAVVADSLIALGVAGEVLFSRKARIGSDELTRRSDEKVAEANARAAEANRLASTAALELAKFRAARNLSKEPAARVTEAMRKFGAGQIAMQFAVAVSDFDQEQIWFASVLINCLTEANWKVARWPWFTEGRTEFNVYLASPASISIGELAVSNVSIASSVSNARTNVAARALVEILQSEGIEASLDDIAPGSQLVLVMIGPKR